jgi:hypothetical protein
MNSITKICVIEGCENIYHARGYCDNHYRIALRNKVITPNYTPEFHGLNKLKEYSIWGTIVQRCYNIKNPSFPYYGARGIKVCDRWRNSFAAFYEDMKKRPTPSHSIDRINVDGNYSCGKCEECVENRWEANCRWATRSEQNINKRINSKNTSGFRGITSRKLAHEIVWRTSISIDNKKYHFGYYETPEEAAYVRDQVMMQLYEYMPLNFEY